MKRLNLSHSRHYLFALRAYLKNPGTRSMKGARLLGLRVMGRGAKTLQMARLHDEAMALDILPGCPLPKRAALIRKAGLFFAAAITPLKRSVGSDQRSQARLNRFIAALSQRTVQLAASNLELSLEVTQRQAVEKALKKSEQHYARLLKQSDGLQDQLRRLSRQILSAHEEERKKISRELHDVIAQTLTGINLRLAILKKDAALNTKGLDLNITRTQKLVERSVNIVHRFARELRPAVLDDLGLVPALQSLVKTFGARTRIPTTLSVSTGMDRLDTTRRTVLFRVAQEALVNVARHAEAHRVRVRLTQSGQTIRLRIQDDGKSFQVQAVMSSQSGRHLGLLGMRERLEMVGGRLEIDSIPGKGTVVMAEIPLRDLPRRSAPRRKPLV